MAEEEKTTSRRKLRKEIEDSVVILEVLKGDQGEMRFDFNELPQEVKDRFGPFGLGHKLGDSAAGKSGVEAEESIIKVWEGLQAGDWSVRAPAVPKVSLKAIADNYEKLSDQEKATALPLLQALGVKIPGLTTE